MYHKYVFDSKNKKFVGKFEEMYLNEEVENFDSWHSSDLTHLPKKIHLSILDQYNFKSILDFGCGKGFFTHLLKKHNNFVEGWDISKTAIAKASQYFGHIVKFEVVNRDFESKISTINFDLIVCLETLSYIKNWRDYLKIFALHSEFIYISLYIPPPPSYRVY